MTVINKAVRYKRYKYLSFKTRRFLWFLHVPDDIVQEAQEDGVPVPRLAFNQLAPIAAAGEVQRRVLPLPRAVVDTDPRSQIQVLAVPAALSHIHRLPDGYQIPGRNNLAS